MTRLMTTLTAAAALLAGGLVAAPALASKAAPSKPGVLKVYDGGKLFTPDGIKRAEGVVAGTSFENGLTVTVDTYEKIPDDKKGGYKEETKAKFFHDWALELAKNDKAKGVYVLICRSPGHVAVIADRETRDRGFTNDNEKELVNTLLKGFRDAKDKPDAEQHRLRDDALASAMNFVVKDLKDTHVNVPSSGGKPSGTTRNAGGGGGFLGGWGVWLCAGFCVLLGVWLVTALIRAFTGGGGGGGYGGGGGMMGGGGGGGGFFSSLLGGMFGAAAGMYLYNNFFGGGSMFGGGSDAYAGGGDDYSNTGDTGAGDFSGDQGAGGDFDGGTGGDYSGGDYSGGDFGGDGGGGDFGGGDF